MREMRWFRTAVVAVLTWAAGAAGLAAEAPRLIDDCDDASLWTAHPADGVQMRLSGDGGERGGALRVDFRFAGGGYAIARRDFDPLLELPENYAFTFRLRGEAPVNHLEFKLVDPANENVWWTVRRDMEFPREWETVTIKKRHMSFAWGPAGGGEIRQVAALEIVVTAGSGGAGTIWIDQLALRPLPPPGVALPLPRATASSDRFRHGRDKAIDGDRKSSWSPTAQDRAPWLALDLGVEREFGGLVIDWEEGHHAPDYVVEASDDGRDWRVLIEVAGGNGGRDYLFLPESEARHLRLRIAGAADIGKRVAVAELAIKPLDWSATREAFFGAIAKEAPRGLYPRGIRGEQPFWAVVGTAEGTREALLSENGALETGPGRFSIEPFMYLDGRLITWADVTSEQSLDSGYLPIPSVTWRHPALQLDVAPLPASDSSGRSAVWLTYHLRNVGDRTISPTLYLALRPFQVNPPSQFLNLRGGCAPIKELALGQRRRLARATVDPQSPPRAVLVDGLEAVILGTSPATFGATTFAGGDIVADHLARGRLPKGDRVIDPFGAASAALSYPFELTPGQTATVQLALPFHPERSWFTDPKVALDQVLEEAAVRDQWTQRLGAVQIDLPPSASHFLETLRSQLGWILVTRAGPAFQPGTRSYARSWIRDGALTGSALLRLGLPEPVREFIEWYAPHQYPSGKIPCVVDARGADPVPEHDSSGQFIYIVAEDLRYTGDREFARSMWPRVRAAAAYLDSLRHERRGDDWRAPDKIEFFGLLPPSISHEGYSAKPMHSYWDDFFALRGFRDAAFLASELNLIDEQTHWSAVAEEFAVDLASSVKAAMARHNIDYVPGCADLGDFDATSTAIAFDPTGAASLLPPIAVERTFERYLKFFRERRDGAEWDAYTPYEMRTIGAFVRLGWRERAGELLDWFLGQQKPIGWRQWPEVVTRNEREPRFLGDLPHTWVGAEFLRSAADMLAYVDEVKQVLVVGAGIPMSWVDETPGVVVRGMPTPFGTLAFTMRRERGADGDAIVIQIGEGPRVPPGGILLCPPVPWNTSVAALDGRPLAADALSYASTALVAGSSSATSAYRAEITVRRLPAEIVLRP